MATTADYLNKLVEQKNALADNLVTKGVSATHSETLETLVPKVLDISGGGESIKYITDGLIGYSDLNDSFVFNPVFDEALGQNVNYCDGSNGYFKSSNNTVISQLTGNITLQVLCKTSTSGAWGEIIVVGTVNGKSAISLGRNENGYLAISDASSAIVTNTIINNDSWHMLTVTYSDGVVCTYVDGVCVGTYNNNINIPSNSVITIGQWLTGVSKYIGYATNACIYNRVLPDAEIIQNWEVDVERYGIGKTKIYWYKNGIFNKSEFDIANSDNWIFVSNTNQSKSISINGNKQIEIVMTQNEAASCSILINSIPIDVTDIKQVIFNIDFSMTPNSDSGSRGTTIAFAISDTNNIGTVSGEWSPETALVNFEKSEYIQNPNNTAEYTGSSHIILDVSNISGERYFYFTHIKPQPEVSTNSDIIKINSIYVI